MRCHVTEFQSTHPSGVRLTSTSYVLPPIYFDPRTPVGCDSHPAGTYQAGDLFQSTHPSGVRRVFGGGRGGVFGISIHAPQWGATRMLVFEVSTASAFQSTHPSGVRQAFMSALDQHAVFQSTHPSGVRHLIPARPACQPYPFQSTHPSGVRRLCGFGSSWETDFNPRTPVGCDRTPPLNRSHSAIFQSTHPSGVRPTPTVGCVRGVIFQSTHPSGVRP